MSSERYARQTMLPEIGPAGQLRLHDAAVLIVGLGGLGSAAAPYLVGAGIGRIGLADPDTVSESNLPRQILYTEAQLGEPKVAAARQRLAALCSATRFDCYPEGITAENAAQIIPAYDLVIDCCDNYPTRYLIDDCCAACGKPWIYGSIGEFCGQASVMNYRRQSRYAALYPDREALCALPRSSSGVLGPLPGIIGAIEAAEAIKLLSGAGESLDGRLFTIDLKTLQTNIFDF